jgi:thioredoxin reductase
MVEVAIIGAGPYGLSIAAHLKPLGLDFRIFGEPMNTWQEHMPKGMRLKSEGFASSLYDPDSAFTLAQYCKEKGLPYADVGLPVPLETFISYGLEFQKRFVPELENKMVVSIARCPSGFQIRLADGEVVVARRVVNAIGLSHYAFVPPILSDLPGELATHSSAHSVLDRFNGAEVAVVGGGSSAVDLAGLLHEAGASVHLVARKPTLRFHDRGQFPRTLLQRIQNPMTGLGPSWKSKFCTDAPLLFRRLPEAFRLKFVRKHLGPSTAWFVKDQVVGKVPFHLGVTVTRASVENHRVNLELTDGSGARQNLAADHVVAGTGYKVDLRRLTFLDSGLVAGIRSVEQTPVLSSNFESSVPGLYFVGASAANSFGPLLRFAFGAGFTAQRLSRHLARSASNGA